MITVKFGGTSLADADRYRHAARIVLADPRRRYVVVSAPGKRFPGDIKITDMLYRFQSTGLEEDFQPIEERFLEIVHKLELNLDLSHDFSEMKKLPHNPDYIASCGEYLSAKIMAAFLGWPFVDTEYCVFFDENGQLDSVKTEAALWEALKNIPHAVLPGFYGALPNGEIHTFSRGGSDITGSLVAKAMDCSIYENWTDVDGILATDPRIVPDAEPIREISYAELRELAYQGATVLHEDAVLPVREAGIPIHIRNTFDPEAPGSWIRLESAPTSRPITGIAGKKGFTTIQIEKEKTNNMVGYTRKILSCLEKRGIPFEHIATGLGSLSLVVPTAAMADCREELSWDIRLAVKPDLLQIQDGLAMIAAVGRGMHNHPGTAAKVLTAVAGSGVNLRMIDAGCTEMNVVLGIDEADFETAIAAIYHCFYK